MTKEDLKVLFDTHPATDEFFITSDDQAFFAENMADAHGQKLKDRAVKHVTRDSLKAAKNDDAPIKHIVTEEDLINNPDLAAAGVKVGDEVELPAKKEVKKTPLQIAQETPEAERTGYQKGLITKAAKAAAEGGAK